MRRSMVCSALTPQKCESRARGSGKVTTAGDAVAGAASSPATPEWLGVLPPRWRIIRLRHLAHSLQTGPFGSQLHSEEYVVGGTPLINPANLSDGKILPNEKWTVNASTLARLSRHCVEVGDILFARRGDLGRCALVTSREAGWLCGTGSIRMRPKLNLVDPDFLNLVLETCGVADWLLLESVGSTMDNLTKHGDPRWFTAAGPRTSPTARNCPVPPSRDGSDRCPG